MGWSIGYDEKWKRDVGYGVPAQCDHPDCVEQIDRGLSHVCGGEMFGGEFGCGLYFCDKHMTHAGAAREHKQLCARCYRGRQPFEPSLDVAEWAEWKLTHESWQQWRDENPAEAEKLKAIIASGQPATEQPQ